MGLQLKPSVRQGRATIKGALHQFPGLEAYLREEFVHSARSLSEMSEDQRLFALGQQSVVESIVEWSKQEDQV